MSSIAKDNTFSIWRGYRSTYDELGANGSLNHWKLYSVINDDGTRSLYWGAQPAIVATGQLAPVIDILDTLPSNLSVGDRYIIGHDGTFDDSGNLLSAAEYYVVEINSDMTQSTVNPLGDFSVRVKNRNMMNYMLVNNKLITYDDKVIDCGEY